MMNTIKLSTNVKALIKALTRLSGKLVTITINNSFNVMAKGFIINEFDQTIQLAQTNKTLDWEQETFCTICKERINVIDIGDDIIEFEVDGTNYILTV